MRTKEVIEKIKRLDEAFEQTRLDSIRIQKELDVSNFKIEKAKKALKMAANRDDGYSQIAEQCLKELEE